MTDFYLLNYSTSEFVSSQKKQEQCAREAGFKDVFAITDTDFKKTAFFEEHSKITQSRRGGGYWIWKPYYILQKLETLSDGDTLVYTDVGRPNSYKVNLLPELMAELAFKHDGFIIGPTTPYHGPLKNWTKRDCLITLNADHPDIYERPIVQATWSLWTKCAQAIEFLRRWLAACCDENCISDNPNVCGEPNHLGFVDHRHDQSVLSILAYQHNCRVLDLNETGIYSIMQKWPNATSTHKLLKSFRNVELILRGDSVHKIFYLDMVKNVVMNKIAGAIR